ncbi:hypothetical protein EVAR_24470_1 [Eumeta japonica]|uniref:Uncharacterized protein n=1 Tax=Eumeta variegata TaxID=151549 RepID=A0A4C1WYW3_EUMVA|nr:hypothetical protein EVAR_24470_1 [Eumeta japonica]
MVTPVFRTGRVLIRPAAASDRSLRNYQKLCFDICQSYTRTSDVIPKRVGGSYDARAGELSPWPVLLQRRTGPARPVSQNKGVKYELPLLSRPGSKSSDGPLAPRPSLSGRSPSVRYLIPSQEAGNAPVTPVSS